MNMSVGDILWRCFAHFENKVHEQHLSVKAMMVLPVMHTVTYRDKDPAAQVLENIENKETELMAFFSYNAAHPEEKHIFQDIPCFSMSH
jgi:hypothetical protein